MLCKDYGIHTYKPTLSKPGLGQGSEPGIGGILFALPACPPLRAAQARRAGGREGRNHHPSFGRKLGLLLMTRARLKLVILLRP